MYAQSLVGFRFITESERTLLEQNEKKSLNMDEKFCSYPCMYMLFYIFCACGPFNFEYTFGLLNFSILLSTL